MALITKTKPNVVFTLGRFQPPHIGHGALIKNVADSAATRNADAYVFVSDKQWSDKDARGKYKVSKADRIKYPLDPATKVTYMEKMFIYPGLKIINTKLCTDVYGTRCNDYFTALALLKSQGYESVAIVLGSDRAEQDMGAALAAKGVEIITIARDEEIANLNNPAGWSATKLRGMASAGNVNSFRKGTISGTMTNKNANNLRTAVKSQLNSIAASMGGSRRKHRKHRKHRTLKRKTHRKYK
jgi:hypothetical protein